MLCISRFLAFALLTSLVVDIFLVDQATAWWERRRRRRRRRTCDKNKPHGVNWVNDWDGRAYFNCPSGKSVSQVKSRHLNCVEDRIWSFDCEPNDAAKNCFWTNPANNYDGIIDFKCPHEGFISGVISWHDNGHEDRQFKFKCCHDPKYWRKYCQYSVETTIDLPFDYQTHYGYYLVGAYSIHNNGAEDRKWKFYSCQKYQRG